MQKLFRIGFPLYILTVIILLLLKPNQIAVDMHFYFLGIRSDKYMHAIMLIPFMVFCRLIFKEAQFIIPFFMGIFFCSFCETLHYFLPYREFSIQDFYANCVGLTIGSSAYLFRKRY